MRRDVSAPHHSYRDVVAATVLVAALVEAPLDRSVFALEGPGDCPPCTNFDDAMQMLWSGTDDERLETIEGGDWIPGWVDVDAGAQILSVLQAEPNEWLRYTFLRELVWTDSESIDLIFSQYIRGGTVNERRTALEYIAGTYDIDDVPALTLQTTLAVKLTEQGYLEVFDAGISLVGVQVVLSPDPWVVLTEITRVPVTDGRAAAAVGKELLTEWVGEMEGLLGRDHPFISVILHPDAPGGE